MKPNTHGKLALRPKSYLIDVHNFGKRGVEEHNYHNFGEAKKHLLFLLSLLSDQVPRKDVDDPRTPKVACSEVLRSKRRDKGTPPTKRFSGPEGASGILPGSDMSYVIWVDYKAFWPMSGECVEYHYHSVRETEKHLRFLFSQVVGQNGKNGIRKNVVLGFQLALCHKVEKTEQGSCPISRFIRPKGRKRPDGGMSIL